MIRRALELLIHEPRERAWRRVTAAEDQAEALKRIADQLGLATQPTLHSSEDYQYIEDAPRDGTLLRLRFEGDEHEHAGFWQADGNKQGGGWVDRDGQEFADEPNFFALAPAYSAADIALGIVTRWLEVVDPPLQLSDKQSRALQWLIVAVLGKAAGDGT